MRAIQQDMTALQSGILFHQVNCRGIMGGGIAASFARKFPGLEAKYRDICELHDCNEEELLGKVLTFGVNKDLIIANIFGQGDVSRHERMTRYDATCEAFERIKRAQQRNPKSNWNKMDLYFPYKMGCGLGGGEWSIYSAILEHYFPNGIICHFNG